MSDGKIVGLASSVGKTRVYNMADGTTETREGGTVAWRNNNPGNLKFEYAHSADSSVHSTRTKEKALHDAQNKYQGVVALDQFGNAVFETEQAGRTAQASLLHKQHGNKTVLEMLPHYAVDDYSGKANIQSYAKGIYAVGDAQGVDLRNKKINDMIPKEISALQDGMKKVEGFVVGTVKHDGVAVNPHSTTQENTVKPHDTTVKAGTHGAVGAAGSVFDMANNIDRTKDPKPVPGAVVTNADHHGAVKHPGVQPTASAHTEHPQTAQATKSHDGLLQHGAHGQEVTDLQTKLKALGAKVQVDGVFGDETLRAVKGYQMMNGLKVDGVYGPNTLAALNTDIARITPQQVHAVTPQPEKAPMTFVDAMKGVTEGQAIASGNTQASIQAPVSPIGDIQVGKVPLTPQDANHPQHKLYESVGKVVQEFEAKNNIPHTQHSEMAVASLTALANKLGMTEVTDFNFDKAKGQFNIGQLNVSPPLVGGMDAGKASITPVQQSFDQMNQLAAVQHREAANEPSLQQQTPPAQEQPKARSM